MKNTFYVDMKTARDLNISGNLLLVYSMIDSMTKDGETFSMRKADMARALNTKPLTVHKCLKKLIEKGLIEQVECVKDGKYLSTFKIIK